MSEIATPIEHSIKQHTADPASPLLVPESSVVQSASVTPVVTVLPPVTNKPAKKPTKKKNRCNFSRCNGAALRIVGDCQFCEGHFCSKHRILENHSCEGLQTCREQMFQRNAEKLQSEQTVVHKV